YLPCCRHPEGGWSCCPFSPSVCCLDGVHCCPYGYKGDRIHTKCLKTDGLSRSHGHHLPLTAPNMAGSFTATGNQLTSGYNNMLWQGKHWQILLSTAT
nr:unnamed protein product [Salmo salar]